MSSIGINVSLLLIGIAKETAQVLWSHIQVYNLDGIFQHTEHLFWTLYFMKTYNSLDVCASYWSDTKDIFSMGLENHFLIDTTLNTVSALVITLMS